MDLRRDFLFPVIIWVIIQRAFILGGQAGLNAITTNSTSSQFHPSVASPTTSTPNKSGHSGNLPNQSLYRNSDLDMHLTSTITTSSTSSQFHPSVASPTTSTPFLLIFRWKDITFDLQYTIASSSKYKNFVAFTERQLITHFAPFVAAVHVIFIRSGSVEVSVSLVIRDGDAPPLERELETRNRSGLLGNHAWIASFWGSQDLSCMPPEVRLQNLPCFNNNKGPAVTILQSKDFIVQGNVLNSSCNSSNILLFKWFLTSYSVNEAGETKIKWTTLLDTTGTQWNLPKRVLDYGAYYVDFRAAFTSNPKMFGSTLGFFTIEKSPLRAKISGGNTVTRGKGKTITLDGSLSQDPDVEPGIITPMNFTWLCKKRNESFPNLSFPIPVVSLTPGPGQGGGGCFGTGVGVLSSNKAVVNLSTSAMNVGEFYDIKLRVQKDTRYDEFVQEIKIVNGTPPEVSIWCIINCGQTTTNARISLTTTCVGDACKSAKYQWLLATLHPPDNKEMAVTLTRNMTETELNLPGIIIKKDALAGDVKYRLKVNVTQAHGPPGISSYQFRMNAPPKGGQCTVKPLNGSALKTLFNIQCSGWKDSETPLTYQFHYKTGGGLYTVVSYGSEDYVETVLPQGQKDKFTFEFSVTIKDKLFAETTLQLPIFRVGPPPVSESFSYNALGSSSRFIKLLQLGKVMGATRLANAVLQTAQQSETITQEEEIKIKSFIVKAVSSVEVGNLQALTQVTSVIARATLEPDQVTVDTQAIALQSLSSLTSLLRKKTREDYASESTLVEEGGENLLLSLGNVLHSAAQKASVVGVAIFSKDVQNKSEGVSEAAEKLIDEVGTSLSSRMVIDQEPKKVKTSSLIMVLNRLSPRSLKTNRWYIHDDVGFKVPFEAIIGEKANDTQFVDFLMTLSAFNPFTWDATSASVKSHVLSLVLKDQDGKLLKVENSEKEVELKIKRDQKKEPIDAKESFFAKPSDNGKMQYHKIDLPDATGNAVRLRIKPTGSTIFKVFVRYGQRPTVTEYDAERKVPDGKCSLNSQRRCNDAAYDFLLVDSVLRKPGSYYIGILYDKSEQERKRNRKRRSCFGKRRQKRSCVEVKEPPKIENVTLIPVYDPKTDVNYSMNVEEEECLFWNRTAEKWQSNGCKVGSNSTTTTLQCLCNHLTSFGGGVLVMPNKLDFNVVFNELTRIHETGNVAVLCTIIATVLLYFLVCVFARRADKKDRAKTGPPLYLNSTLEEGFQYQLTIVTGVWMNSGTDANVTIVIHGSDTESQPIILNRNMTESRTILARGNEDQFVIHLPAALGEVQYVRIWHDNSGKTPSWFLSYVTIKDLQTENTLTFPCNTWFALEKGDGKIDRLLSPISYEETRTFMYSLNSRGSQSFCEGHMWLSVVTKPPKSKFTRFQRTTCCLCLLMSAMLVNALFYKPDQDADPKIQIGPLRFSWRQVVVGLQSALIVTPVNLLIVAIFKNTAEKRYNKVMPSASKGKRASVKSRVPVVSCWGGATGTKHETEEKECCSPRGRTSVWTRTIQRAKLMTKEFLFPHYFLYIAWVLSFLTVASSATFTFYFSLQWGKDISNEWLSSVLVSFTEDLFVLQPIKIVLIMLIMAYFFGFKSELEKVDLSIQSEHASYVNARGDASQSMKVQPPHEDEIEQARRYLVKEAKMFSFGRELFLYLFFLTLLTIVCYGNRSYHGYLITNNLHDTYVHFSLAKDPRSYWKWLRWQFVNGVYANEWYNGKIATKQEYINNKKSILLGMPRLRQMRIKKDTCDVPEVARASIQHCYDYYSIDKEEKNPHNLPGWEPFRGSSNWANFSNLCPAPWNYVPQEKLHGSPSWGFFDIYSGGGYVADLGYNKATASPLIDNLQKYGWIDRQTRAVVLEFVVYNGNTGYLSISSFYYEILPIGCGHPFAIIDTFPLTSTQTGFYEFFLICQLLFIILVILFVFREVYAIYQLRCTYFRDPWNFVELFQIMFSFLEVVLYVVKSKAVLNSTIKVKDNPFVSVSFRDAVLWNNAENMMLAITVFITTVKMLRMIRFNRHIGILMSSFRESGGLLLSYSIIFIIVFSAYAQLGMQILGSHMREYSSFLNAVASEFLMCLGSKMSLHDLTRVNRILGPLFGFSFVLLNAFIFVNFFVAMLNDTHAVVKHNVDKQSEEYEMADFILDRLQEFLGFRKNPRYDSSSETEDNKQESEMKGMSKTAFSSVAFQSHQLRRRARKIQLRNATKSKEIARKKNKRHKNRLNEDRAGSGDVNQTATEEKQHRFQSSDPEMASLIPSNETIVLSRLGTLTSQVARDNLSEDIEMLSLIRLIRYMEALEKEKEEATAVEDAMSKREAQKNDVEVASCVTTPNPPLTSSPNAYDDISRHSVFGEELSHETPQMPNLTRSKEDLVKEKEDADVGDAMSEREAQLDDIEVASCVTTPNPSLSACPNTCDDISSHSASSEELSHETTQLLRQLNAGRQLPEHLTGKRMQQNLRA
ncbi:polycystic kidney disease protein 1-like 2 [Acropora millepora]|uniref:polycystic kidney disease protein 1-like 2 n=1 Tax=Acropora millepora TaxID=45264 RepID=UPI001CF5ECB3|nr:polycystic kidney disease protein 1-like 2 [Acropora millepora]